MADIVERLRRGWLNELNDEELCEAASEIERLRETIRQADYVFELLMPENHGQTSEAEMASLLSSVAEKTNGLVMSWDRAALEEKK